MSDARGATVARTSLLIRNARIGSGGPLGSVAIADGRIVSITPDVPPERADDEVDARGRTLLPGLSDAHVHMVQWASARRRIDVSTAASAREAAESMARHAGRPAGTAPGEPLIGFGFRDGLWDDRPHRDLLDWAGERVVALVSNDLHTAWLGPSALTRLGRGHHPTGVLREQEALDAVARLARVEDTVADTWVADALSAAAERGVTHLVDFEYADNVRDWTRRTAGRTPAVHVTCTIYPEYLEAAIAAGLRTGDPVPGSGGAARVGPLKLFVDGSLNTRTALCNTPYPGVSADGQQWGILQTPPHELERAMARAAAHGIDSAVHAIGDRAATIALDAFERVGCPGRIEHAQLIDPADLPRFTRPDLILGVQPAHAPDDRDVADHHWAGRTHRAYAYADLLKAGAVLEIGSDAPVSPLDPWRGIAAAVHRGGGQGRAPWHPEQAIGLPDALAAAAAGRRGIQVGEAADLVLTDHDPADLSPHDLARMPVHATLLGGRWTFRAT
ncbi:amidohydrolase family protein [Streptomyces sp. SID5785]|uniref:amidohydrolase n=1 Tax=Streptomyces sp. SID5785 TaxID=2690309 RepID=UPI001360F8F9|nr:amidohydrolase family protein [Streptomyces sp. SID5785]MZD10431.1 amidohydrolase family protein [Streptomyces sp. SID5785]